MTSDPGGWEGWVDAASVDTAKDTVEAFVIELFDGLPRAKDNWPRLHALIWCNTEAPQDRPGRFAFTVPVFFDEDTEAAVTLGLLMPGVPVETMTSTDPATAGPALCLGGVEQSWLAAQSAATVWVFHAMHERRRITMPADDGTVLGPPRTVRAREIAVGHYVHRRFPFGEDAGWFRVTTAQWRAAERRFYVRFERPYRLRNLLPDHYKITPVTPEVVRDPVESEEN